MANAAGMPELRKLVPATGRPFPVCSARDNLEAMKYAIVIPDGCADEPQEDLDGKTPLQVARLPNMDEIAAQGVVGRANHVPPHLPAGSAVANLSLMGYDPNEHFSGRAPLEAAAQGIEMGPDDWAIRCNLVTVEDQIMRDFTADHISTEEAAQLLKLAQEKITSGLPIEFVTGVSYRNLLMYRPPAGQSAPFTTETVTRPPHDLPDLPVLDDYPRGPGSDMLDDLMSASVSLFENHEINQRRIQAGKRPATNLWLWGQGRRPDLQPFQQRYGLRGTMITAVDLLRGIAALIGWNRIEVPGATGYTDTDYAAKGAAAIVALDETDLICVHVEATDEASHEGDTGAKIAALEAIDEHVVGPLLETMRSRGDYRMMVTPDHPTPLRTKVHSHGFVPFAMAGSNIDADSSSAYDEVVAAQSELNFVDGWRLMDRFVKV